jgi:hypothetical protein
MLEDCTQHFKDRFCSSEDSFCAEQW